MTTPATPVGAEPQRRTRVPDWLTDLVLVVTGVFAIWGVGLAILTAFGILQPGFAGLGFKTLMKVIGATIVAVLAMSQFYTMHAVMGHLPRGRFKIKQLMRAHRYGGRIAILLAALVAVFCIVDIGAPNQPLRVVVHVVAGCTAFTALAVKFTLIRFRPALAYDLAPNLGGIAAVAFIAIWLTSALFYFTGNL